MSVLPHIKIPDDSILIQNLYINNKNSQKKVIFNSSVAICWAIWNERNNRIFKDKEANHNTLWDNIYSLVGNQCYRWKLFLSYNPTMKSLKLSAFSNLFLFFYVALQPPPIFSLISAFCTFGWLPLYLFADLDELKLGMTRVLRGCQPSSNASIDPYIISF